MGPKQRPVNRQRSAPYDPELAVNWTVTRLREELNNRGINVPLNSRRMALVRLLQKDSRQKCAIPQCICAEYKQRD